MVLPSSHHYIFWYYSNFERFKVSINIVNIPSYLKSILFKISFFLVLWTKSSTDVTLISSAQTPLGHSRHQVVFFFGTTITFGATPKESKYDKKTQRKLCDQKTDTSLTAIMKIRKKWSLSTSCEENPISLSGPFFCIVLVAFNYFILYIGKPLIRSILCRIKVTAMCLAIGRPKNTTFWLIWLDPTSKNWFFSLIFCRTSRKAYPEALLLAKKIEFKGLNTIYYILNFSLTVKF